MGGSLGVCREKQTEPQVLPWAWEAGLVSAFPCFSPLGGRLPLPSVRFLRASALPPAVPHRLPPLTEKAMSYRNATASGLQGAERMENGEGAQLWVEPSQMRVRRPHSVLQRNIIQLLIIITVTSSLTQDVCLQLSLFTGTRTW